MSELKKHTSFKALKLDEKLDNVDQSKNNIFQSLKLSLKDCKANAPIKRKSKQTMESSLTGGSRKLPS